MANTDPFPGIPALTDQTALLKYMGQEGMREKGLDSQSIVEYTD